MNPMKDVELAVLEPDQPVGDLDQSFEYEGTEDYVREIYHREARGSSMVAMARLFGNSRTIFVKRSAIYTRCEYMHLFRIGNTFNPHHKLYKKCMKTLYIIAFVHAYYTAFDMAFGSFHEPTWLLSIDLVIDALFVVEMYVQSKTALYLAASDVFVGDDAFVKQRFIELKLLPRLVHTLPFQLLHYLLTPKHVSYSKALFIKFLRLLKLIRVKTMFFTTENRYIQSLSKRGTWTTLIFILCRFAAVSHLIACFLYAISFIDTAKPEMQFFGRLCNQWGLQPGCEANMPQMWIYSVCLYYAITITTTVGFGNIWPYSQLQLVLNMLAMVIGACHNALLIANILDTIQEFSADRKRYAKSLASLEYYTETKNFPDALRSEIKTHFDYQWSRTRCVDENEFLKRTMSDTLRLRIIQNLYLTPMKKVYVFQNVQESCLFQIMSNCIPLFVRKNEQIYTKGQLGTAFYIILKGTVHVFINKAAINPLTTEGMTEVYEVFEKNAVFGEEVMLDKHPIRKKNAVAETTVDLIQFDKEIVCNVLKNYVELQNNMIKAIKEKFSL
jgi:hypothetical protein